MKQNVEKVVLGQQDNNKLGKLKVYDVVHLRPGFLYKSTPKWRMFRDQQMFFPANGNEDFEALWFLGEDEPSSTERLDMIDYNNEIAMHDDKEVSFAAFKEWRVPTGRSFLFTIPYGYIDGDYIRLYVAFECIAYRNNCCERAWFLSALTEEQLSKGKIARMNLYEQKVMIL